MAEPARRRRRSFGLQIGSIATAAQAGARFKYQLVWSVLLATICIVFLVEMAGRFAAVSRHTIADGIRERFGFNAFLISLVANILLNFMVIAAEIGGVAIALELATDISYRWWALPVSLAAWLFLWKGTFGLIEKGVALLGLVTLCFVVAAFMAKPDWWQIASGALPSLPRHDAGNYWFIAVSIFGASISPYLFMFYSSGAVEDQWDESFLGTNRAIAGLGMSFGGMISIAVLIVAGIVLSARGISQVDDYHQLPLLMLPIFGFWGFLLFIASLGIACFGATLEIGLQQAYLVAQGFGWNWGENKKPREDPAFSTVYTLSLPLAALPMALGADPLQITILAMALTAASLPLTVVPFLFLLNDERYVGQHKNGKFSNAAVIIIIALAFVLAVVALPLQIFGGS
ncbi:divalent metal cation transporter [Rhizobium sp. IBUN]|uniref:NRAMP family divalent metal transporter n=1 Tax=Rhizobium sp. IBUN TaxID=1042326 RepID=UPI00046FCDC3|nr:divalent metal cation transporter [Rhizobium sp. IBUN]